MPRKPNSNRTKLTIRTRLLAPASIIASRQMTGASRCANTTTTTTTIQATTASNNKMSIMKPNFSLSIVSYLALVLISIALTGGIHRGQIELLADGAKLPDIYWNSSNPIFRIDNTDHIFDVNKKQHDHDQVDLVCPQAQLQQQQQVAPQQADSNKTITGTNEQPQQAQLERYIIYSVSKEEYDTCRLNGPSSAQVVAKCDQPQATSSGAGPRPVRPTTITFRSFTPQPNGLEFKPGQDYYFITALHGHHQDPQKRFSPCRELNMRVIFKVCCKPSTPANSASGLAAVISPQPKPLVASSGAGQQPQQPSVSVNNPNKGQLPSRGPSVMTVRPTFKPNLNEYFGSLVGAAGGATGSQQQQQQQPVTVLPIEVISSPATEVQGENKNSNNNNDPMINEQPVPGGPPSAQPAPAPQQPPRLPFIPFDPTATPDKILNPDWDRWAPTPLPAQMRPLIPPQQPAQPHQPSQYSNLPPQKRPQDPRPAPWQLPPSRTQISQDPQHTAPTPTLRHPHQQISDRNYLGRANFYPWSTHVPQQDLITVAPPGQGDLQPGDGGSAGTPFYAVALLVPLLVVAILLALGLERRLR
uniref:Ephrin-A1 n=1 Tax=Aceria tosichella TaxID=561515 RepID=A0A6G1SJV5_9ACAR